MSDEPAPEVNDAPVADQSVEESPPVESQAENSYEAPAAEQPSQPAASPEQPTVWSAFRSLPDFQGQEDAAIAQSLYQSMEREKAAQKALAQYQRLIPYANEYIRHKDDFERFLSAKDAPQAPAAPQQQPQQAASSWWSPPEIKDSYRRYILRDENGREVISQDAPPEARVAIEDYMEYRANFANKFLANPEEALGPMVEQIAQQKANELLQQQLEVRDQESYVTSLEREHADWLYEEDGQTPTAEGLAVQRYIEQAAQFGIANAEQRWEYATSMVERDLLEQIRESDQRASAYQQALSAQPPQAPVAEAPVAEQPMAQNQAERDIDYLRREASRNPSRSTGASDPRAPKAPMTFEERLKAQLAKDNLI